MSLILSESHRRSRDRYIGRTMRMQSLAGDTCHGHRPLIIGAGMKKTGTTTLGDVLVKLLGWRSMCSIDTKFVPFRCDTLQSLSRVDAVEDEPWCCNHQLLAAAVHHYPCSKVVLTTRDAADWYTSISTWIEHRLQQGDSQYPISIASKLGLRPTAYNRSSLFRRSEFIRAYASHNQFVRALFTTSSSRMIELDWRDSTSAGRLCDFLGINQSTSIYCDSSSLPHCRQKGAPRCANVRVAGGTS